MSTPWKKVSRSRLSQICLFWKDSVLVAIYIIQIEILHLKEWHRSIMSSSHDYLSRRMKLHSCQSSISKTLLISRHTGLQLEERASSLKKPHLTHSCLCWWTANLIALYSAIKIPNPVMNFWSTWHKLNTHRGSSVSCFHAAVWTPDKLASLPSDMKLHSLCKTSCILTHLK